MVLQFIIIEMGMSIVPRRKGRFVLWMMSWVRMRMIQGMMVIPFAVTFIILAYW